MQNNKIRFLLSCVLIINCSPLFAKEVVDKIITVVNNEPILSSDLNSFSGRLKQQGSIDETLLLDDTLTNLKSDSKKQLQYLIREKLIESEVKKQNLSISDEKVESELNSIAQRNKMSKSQFNEYIKKQGFTVTEYKENLKNRIERQSFFESEIISKLRITDEDAYNEFRQKNSSYVPSLNEYTIAQIFVPFKSLGQQDALTKAELLRKKISDGQSFESVVNAYNEGTSEAKNGLLGTFKAGEFNKEIEKEISNLNAGDVSNPIKSKQGYHIVKVLDKKNSQDPQFLKIKEQIKSYLVEKNFKRQLKNWFESKLQDSSLQML